MKKIFSIFLTIATVAFMAVSCQEEAAYEPGPQDVDGCYGVYFPSQPATGSHTYDPTMPTVQEFIVARTVSDDSIDVPYEVVDPKGIYQCGPIHFDAGQKETTFEVKFDKAEMGVEYPLTISITDNNYASFYGDKQIAFDFSAFRVEWKYFADPKTGEPAVIHYTEGWNGTTRTAKIKYYEVDGVRTCVTESDPLVDGGDTYYGFWAGQDNPDDALELNFIWYTNGKCYGPDGEVYECIQVPEQGVQFHDSYGMMVKYYDYYAYWTILNPQDALVGMDYVTYCSKYSGNYQSSYYDGNGGFYFYCKYYYMIGLGGWGVDDFDPICIADGYTRTDYSIEAESDYTVDGEVPVYFTAGADVASIKYAAVEGELTATQAAKVVDAIIDGSQEGIETIDEFEFDEDENLNYAAVALSFDVTDFYTVVAVTYDANGKAQDNTSVVVNYISPDDAEANAVEISIGAEAVPARYELDPYTTMAYYIAGHVLTDVHVAIVPLAKVTDATFDEVKYDASYAVDSETLAKINATGGLYDYVEKLNANTEYVLIVWATNGSLDKTTYALYTTPKLPYKWNSLGMGVYTEDVLSYLYGYHATLKDGSDYQTYDVEVEVFQEANDPGLIMFDPSLAVAAQFFDITEEEMSEYEGGNWRHAQIIIDVTDPNNVIWEEQDYGVKLSSADGWCDGVTNMYNGKPFSVGTFKDGVIAFPTVKGMLCTLNGDGYYYADGSGKTRLVLPSSVKIAAAKANVIAPAGGELTPVQHVRHSVAVPMCSIAIERDIKAASCTVKSIAPKAQKSQGIDKNNITRSTREDIAF